MSRFLLLNFQDFNLNQDITQTIQLHTLLCICCLKKNVPLINLANCKHSSYLHFFSAPELEPSKKVVCYQCHNELKKIELFRRQVQESFKLLSNKSVEFQTYQSLDVAQLTKPVINLEIKKTVNIYLPPTKSTASRPHKVLKRKEDSKINSQGNVEDVDKVETDSDRRAVKEEAFGNTGKILKDPLLPDTKIKSEPKEHTDIEINRLVQESQDPETEKRNKVRTIKLTNEELMRERIKLAQSRTYIKFPYKCKHCIIGFNYEENIKDHMERKHGPKLGSVTCEVCLQVLHPPGSLNAHLYRHFTRYDCEQCGKRHNSYNDALLHYKREHEATDLYRCRFCGYTTEYYNKLKYHKMKHHKKYSCKHCGIVLATPESLRRHMSQKHGSPEDVCRHNTNNKCPECPRSFPQQLDLEEHLQIHDENNRSDKICEHCNESYEDLENLVQHMQAHMAMAVHT